MNVSVYIVRREPKHLTHYEAPPNWDGLWLDRQCDPGDVVVARIDLEGGPVDGVGPTQLSVRCVRGLADRPALAGKIVLPLNSADCIACVLSSTDGCLQVNVEAAAEPTVSQRNGLPSYMPDPDELWNVRVRRSRIGGGWRPVAEIVKEIAEARPELDRIAARHGQTIATVLEARWASHALTGGGTQTALVQFAGDAGDNGVHVVEWGCCEDGPWESIVPLVRHNQIVNEANDAV